MTIPNQLAKAEYCSLWAWTGISLAISWWMIGKNGGQFLSSTGTPAGKHILKTRKNKFDLMCIYKDAMKRQLKIWYGRISSFTFSNRIFSSFYILHMHLKESKSSKAKDTSWLIVAEAKTCLCRHLREYKYTVHHCWCWQLKYYCKWMPKNQHRQLKNSKPTFSLLFKSASHTASSWLFFLESP